MEKQKILLKGTPVNKGIATGKARVIPDILDDELMSKELQKLKKGEILVTEMTRPIFVICMRKTAAIITERGGILCHAAMVSREFDLPCIVNAQEATKILKNGQKIFVDANKGIIYEA